MKFKNVIILFISSSFNLFSQIPNNELLPAQDFYKVKVNQNIVYWIDSVKYSNGAVVKYQYDSLGNRTTYTKEPAPPKAELHIVEDQIPDTLGLATQSQHVATAWNSGVVPANNFTIQAFLSSDSLLTGSDPTAGSTSVNTLILVTSYKDILCNIEIPANTTPNQWYWLFLHIDHSNQVVEYSDSNNIYSTKVYITECGLSPNFNSTVKPSVCNQANGEILLNTPAGYNLQWSTGNTDSLRRNLIEGHYVFELTNADNSCVFQDSIFVSALPELQVQSQVIPATCNENNGSIQLNPSSGVAPFSYNWAAFPDTNFVRDLSPGQYTVEVSDSVGCQVTVSLQLPAVPKPQLTLNATDTKCGEANGSIKANVAAGISPYTYEWSNGDTLETTGQLAPAEYSITVTDSSGCSVSRSVRVEASSQLFAEIERTGNTLKAKASQGTAPFTYNWSNGDQGTSIRAIENGIYEVTITDASGCSAIDNISIDNIDISTSVEDINGEAGTLYVYPNPSDGNAVMLHCEVDEQVIIKIYKETGQLIHTQQSTAGNNNAIGLNKVFTSGTYILVAQTEDGSQVGARVFIVN